MSYSYNLVWSEERGEAWCRDQQLYLILKVSEKATGLECSWS